MEKSTFEIVTNPGPNQNAVCMSEKTKIRIRLSNRKEFDISLDEKSFQIRETTGETIGISCKSSNCIDII